MQPIELEANITQTGSIQLPPYCKEWFGKHAKLIVQLPDQASLLSEKEDLDTILEAAWGTWGNKTLDEIDQEIIAKRNADWER